VDDLFAQAARCWRTAEWFTTCICSRSKAFRVRSPGITQATRRVPGDKAFPAAKDSAAR